jgi:hypothetical protein
MILIATGNPTAKADGFGEGIELRIPSGTRESVTLDLTLHQCVRLEQQLRQATAEFYKAQRANADWRSENVLDFAAHRARVRASA